MSKEFRDSEIDKIFEMAEWEFPKNMAMAAIWILGNLKGINLKVLDVSKMSSLGDYFVIASASNYTQASAMAEELLIQMKRHGYMARSVEGKNGADWLLIDLGDIIVHIFLEAARTSYGLEQLWKEAVSVEIPQAYYYSDREGNPEEASEDKGYF